MAGSQSSFTLLSERSGWTLIDLPAGSSPAHRPLTSHRCGRSWRQWRSLCAWWRGMTCIVKPMMPTASSSCKRVGAAGCAVYCGCLVVEPQQSSSRKWMMAAATPLCSCGLTGGCCSCAVRGSVAVWLAGSCCAAVNLLRCILRPHAGEALALRGMRRISCLHGPAVVGQAAVFSAYVDECRSRLHTGENACTACTAAAELHSPAPAALSHTTARARQGPCCPAEASCHCPD